MNLSPRHLLCSLEVSTEILTSEPNIIVPDHPSIHLTVPGLFKGRQMDGKGRLEATFLGLNTAHLEGAGMMKQILQIEILRSQTALIFVF